MPTQKLGREISFLMSLVAMGLIFGLLSYEEYKVALLRMDVPLRADRALNDEINQRCQLLYARGETKVEKFFLDHLSPSSTATGTEPCLMSIVSEAKNRFFLHTQWDFRIEVKPENGARIERNYIVEFPRPLVLLPLAGFLLALIFEVHFWTLSGTVLLYLFALGGGNLIRTATQTTRSLWLAMTTDAAYPGLLLLLLWLAVYRCQKTARPLPRKRAHPWERITSRLMGTLVGLWNPAAYTLTARLFFPFRGALSRLTSFFDSQFLIFALSLYLLSVDIKSYRDLLEKGIFLPRYFSFAALLFFGLTYWSTPIRRQVILWQIPRFAWGFASVILIELLSWRVPGLRDQSFLVRAGGALALSEVIRYKHVAWGAAVRVFTPWAFVLTLATFIPTHSQESGVKDLVLVLLEPKMHPSVMAFFTFLAGMGLGFVTGNFSASFFALFTSFLQAQETPLLRAALLDGILAGNFLSPFSIFNLLPCVQFELKLRQLIAFRFRQLAIPLLIGAAIFAVSAINSVAILQPVTFVFLCLLIATLQLKKSAWTLGKFSLTVHSETR